MRPGMLVVARLGLAIIWFIAYVFVIVGIYGWSLIQWAVEGKGGIILFKLPGDLL